jgi:hypothetical protein
MTTPPPEYSTRGRWMHNPLRRWPPLPIPLTTDDAVLFPWYRRKAPKQKPRWNLVQYEAKASNQPDDLKRQQLIQWTLQRYVRMYFILYLLIACHFAISLPHFIPQPHWYQLTH